MNSEVQIGTLGPKWKSRWWLKVRDREALVPGEAVRELYTPIWAIPLDLLHAVIFGSTKIGPVEQS